MPDKAKVSAGKPKIGGYAFKAPLGTTLPTTALETLDSAFKDAGYISEDGLVNAKTRGTSEIKDWGGETVLNPQTSKTDTFQVTFIEAMNTDMLEAFQGDGNVSGDVNTGLTIRENSDELSNYVWVFEMELNGGYWKRIVIPDAKITETGEVTYKSDEAIAYNGTITAYASDDIEGDTHREYIQKIPSSDTLSALTVTSAAGSTSGKTAITVTPAKASSNIYKYKVGNSAEGVTYDMDLSSWSTWDGAAEIAAATGNVITIAETTSAGKARKAGHAAVTAHA